MTSYQPTTPRSDAMVRPDCPACSAPMRLFGIESSDLPDLDLLSFECPNCLHIEAKLGKAD